MKKSLALFCALVMLCSIALAETTTRGIYTTPISPLTKWLNENDKFHHNHGYDKYERETPIGLGVDLTLWNFTGAVNDWGFDNVELQNKWDINNSEYSMFGVVQVDVPRLFNKVRGR